MSQSRPVVEEHEGVLVVRDDLHPGGTKARFIMGLFDGTHELIYASPAEGGAQYSIAACANELSKRATIFIAARKAPHPRQIQIRAMGANVQEVRPGYLTVVQARARTYAAISGGRLLPFGLDIPEAPIAIAEAARMTELDPDEVWCAGGSGVLARGLGLAWPDARINVVQVGRALKLGPRFKIWKYPKPFESAAAPTFPPPFPSDPHYDAKAWSFCRSFKSRGRVVFWNVLAGASQ